MLVPLALQQRAFAPSARCALSMHESRSPASPAKNLLVSALLASTLTLGPLDMHAATAVSTVDLPVSFLTASR